MSVDSTQLLAALVVLVPSVLMLAHGLVGVFQTIYIWDRPERLEESGIRRSPENPHYGFSILVPAHEEHAVIGETIRRLAQSEYPINFYEILVICADSDRSTIAAAEDAIWQSNVVNARVVTFPGNPGKSRGLNVGLSICTFDLVTIFDAEDDVSPNLLSIVNDIYVQETVDVVQCGVQLMNFRSHWWAIHNVLEYFFWFKSRMHYYARQGSVPLGGNTVFFRKSDLEEIGGWNERRLTEDADIGIRLSLAGKRFTAMYDPVHVTGEEVPATIRSFVKQRTRWNQGFVQIFLDRSWRRLPTLQARFLTFYLLTAPIYLLFVVVATPIMVTVGMSAELPVRVSLFSFTPLLLTAILVSISIVGLNEFGRDQQVKLKVRDYVVLVVTYVPYMLMLFVSALRAIAREAAGKRSWEKTEHLGEHRSSPAESLIRPNSEAESTASGTGASST